MATDNAIRITVRIVIPDSTYPPTAIDLAIPQQSSIADILDEVLDLAGAPTISWPWQATTAAGTAIDAAEPLSHTQLTHGSTLILSPHHDLEPPVLCDAAEALANQPDSATDLGLNSIITGVGVALALCCVFSPVAAAVPLWARLLCAGLIAFAVALKIPADSQGSNRTTTLCILCIAAVSCTFAAGLCMILPPPLSLDDLAHTPWAIAAAAGCAALMLAACHALVAPPPQLVVAIATILVTLTLSSLALVLRPTPSSVAAATIAVAVIAIIASPWLALRISGLKVPRLPAPAKDSTSLTPRPRKMTGFPKLPNLPPTTVPGAPSPSLKAFSLAWQPAHFQQCSRSQLVAMATPQGSASPAPPQCSPTPPDTAAPSRSGRSGSGEASQSQRWESACSKPTNTPCFSHSP